MTSAQVCSSTCEIQINQKGQRLGSNIFSSFVNKYLSKAQDRASRKIAESNTDVQCI